MLFPTGEGGERAVSFILFIFASYQQIGRFINKTGIVSGKPCEVQFLMFSFAPGLNIGFSLWERLSL